MTYLVHINPTPGSDLRVVEIDAKLAYVDDGVLVLHFVDEETSKVAAIFAKGVWNYMEPKK